MATTRLMPVHAGKGRSASKAISDIIDYVENPEKTENGKWITAYNCDSRTADTEFLLSKKQYGMITGREQGERGVLAYHIRQAFFPGEVTPELAMTFTKRNHQFIVATHTDCGHIHNHIIFCSASLDCARKFRNFWGSSRAIRNISDRLCLENGLSIVENPQPSRGSYGTWLGDGKPLSWQKKLRQSIDAVLDGKPADILAFVKAMEASGYEVKQGKYLAFRAPGQTRFTRLRSLGEDYTDAAVSERISRKRSVAPKRQAASKNAATQPPKIRLLIDLQNCVKVKDSPGYAQWAKVFNLKQLARTFSYIDENNIADMGELAERAEQSARVYNGLSSRIKAAEGRMTEINELQKYIGNYSRTRDIYKQYKESGYGKKFLAANESAITIHKAAKKAFDALGIKKLPSIKSLQTEYAELQDEKNKLYRDYKKAREEMQTAALVKANAAHLLQYSMARTGKENELSER